MVTDGLSTDQREGGGVSRPSSIFLRYAEKFEELCPYYLSLGMTYADYWDGDAAMVKAYRQKDEYVRERENFNFWLQGMYIYEALLDVSPVLRPFAKNAKPQPYRSEPVPINLRQTEEMKKRENERKLKNGKEAMMAMMVEINKRFEKQE